MASPTWWALVWVDSGSWWWTGKPSLLQSMGSQRVRHDWETELADWFIGRTDAEAESRALILWPPDAKSQLIGKDPDAGKDWRQEEKGIIEGEMIGWHHRLNGQVFEQASGHCEGQGRLECYSPWGHEESDMTAWLNSIGIFSFFFFFFSYFTMSQNFKYIGWDLDICWPIISIYSYFWITYIYMCVCVCVCVCMYVCMYVYTVYGILQARRIELVSMPSKRDLPDPQDGTHVSWIADRFFIAEPPGKFHVYPQKSLDRGEDLRKWIYE